MLHSLASDLGLLCLIGLCITEQWKSPFDPGAEELWQKALEVEGFELVKALLPQLFVKVNSFNRETI